MRRLMIIGIVLFIRLTGQAQPFLNIDSTFSHAQASDKLALFQERLPVQPFLTPLFPFRAEQWQRVSGIHYGRESLRGRGLFRCLSPTNRTVWLELTSHFIDTLRISIVRPDTLLCYSAFHYRHLAGVPDAQRPYLPVRHRYPAIAVPLLANQPTTVVIEGVVAYDDHLKFGVHVWEPEAFLFHQQQDTWWWAFFVGIYLMAALIGLLNYLVDRQLIFLYYALYVGCLTVYALLNDGWGAYLPPAWQWLDSRYTLAHCLNTALFSFLCFCQHFLSLSKPRDHLFASPVSLWLVVALTVELVRFGELVWPGNNLIFRMGIVGATGYGALLMYYLVRSFRQHRNPAPTLFLLVAVLAMGFYYGSNLLFNAIGFPSPVPDMLLFRLAFLLELLILTLGWLYRQRYIRQLQLSLEKENRRQAESLNTAQTDLLNAQETERRRIAQDLHDDIGTSLIALRGKLPTTAPDAHHLLDQIITDVRAVSHNLMPDELTSLGLAGAVGEAARRLQESSHIQFLFVSAGAEVRLSPAAELALYRVVLELMHNVVRHSQATEATVQLVYHSDLLNVTVEDNGRGFHHKKEERVAGIGLKSVASRAEWLGAWLAIDTSAMGTTIRLDIPYANHTT